MRLWLVSERVRWLYGEEEHTCVSNHQSTKMPDERAGGDEEGSDDHPEDRCGPGRDLPASDVVVRVECVSLYGFGSHQGEHQCTGPSDDGVALEYKHLNAEI